MYKNFRVRNYRGFDDLRISQFSKVNLIAGKNSVGKSALLEALFIHAGAHNPDLATIVNSMRGMTKVSIDLSEEHESPWDSLFLDFDNRRTIEFSGDAFEHYSNVRLSNVRSTEELESLSMSVRKTYQHSTSSEQVNAKVLKLELRRDKLRLKKYEPEKLNPKRYFLIYDRDGKKILPYPPKPFFPAKYHLSSIRSSSEEEAARFSKVLLHDKKRPLLAALNILEPRLTDLQLIYEHGETILEGDIGIGKRRFVPLAMMGEGLGRIAAAIASIANTEGGVVFMDDVDSGLHHSALIAIWTALREAVDLFDVQLFISTHRGESIKAAFEAFAKDYQDYLSVHRLDKTDKGISVASYDYETLGAALDGGLEVR